MDDCGSRIKQLEQLLSEYQDRLQLDKDSDFAEGIFIRFNRNNINIQSSKICYIAFV